MDSFPTIEEFSVVLERFRLYADTLSAKECHSRDMDPVEPMEKIISKLDAFFSARVDRLECRYAIEVIVVVHREVLVAEACVFVLVAERVADFLHEAVLVCFVVDDHTSHVDIDGRTTAYKLVIRHDISASRRCEEFGSAFSYEIGFSSGDGTTVGSCS